MIFPPQANTAILSCDAGGLCSFVLEPNGSFDQAFTNPQPFWLYHVLVQSRVMPLGYYNGLTGGPDVNFTNVAAGNNVFNLTGEGSEFVQAQNYRFNIYTGADGADVTIIYSTTSPTLSSSLVSVASSSPVSIDFTQLDFIGAWIIALTTFAIMVHLITRKR